MGFAASILGFKRKVDATNGEVFAGVATAVHASVVEGSPVTGAPGQPVDTGHLKNSFHLAFPSATVAEITTNVEYAPDIETGRGMTLRSKVGGFHSVKSTRVNFDKLVEDVTKKVVGNG